MRSKIKRYFIPSGKDSLYIEFGYPHRRGPAPAVIVAHGLRSYYSGFLNMFAKRFRQAGYISVKFHFVGTGRSSGKFEDKTTAAMLKNYEDVLDFVAAHPDVRGIGLVGRSNAGCLAVVHGPDPRIQVYALLAPSAYYSRELKKFIAQATIKGNFFYHHSFKRPHTKGQGRLPLDFVQELKRFDVPLLRHASKMRRVILFQSTKDEACTMHEGHFDFWKKILPQPRKLVLIEGGNHSYKGHKRFVIEGALQWFRKYLPSHDL